MPAAGIAPLCIYFFPEEAATSILSKGDERGTSLEYSVCVLASFVPLCVQSTRGLKGGRKGKRAQMHTLQAKTLNSRDERTRKINTET